MPRRIHIVDRDIGEPLGEVVLHVLELLIAREDADVDVLAGGRAADSDAVVGTQRTGADHDDAVAFPPDAEGRTTMAAIQQAFADRRDAGISIGSQEIDAREAGLGQAGSIGDGRCDVEITP